MDQARRAADGDRRAGVRRARASAAAALALDAKLLFARLALAIIARREADLTRASRFEARFVIALVRDDRTQCAAIADELPEDCAIGESPWLGALAVQAVTHAASERASVRARIEADALCLARLRAAAPWLLEALEAPR
jgi:hypothetical protein